MIIHRCVMIVLICTLMLPCCMSLEDIGPALAFMTRDDDMGLITMHMAVENGETFSAVPGMVYLIIFDGYRNEIFGTVIHVDICNYKLLDDGYYCDLIGVKYEYLENESGKVYFAIGFIPDSWIYDATWIDEVLDACSGEVYIG